MYWVGQFNLEECLAEQGQAFWRMSVPLTLVRLVKTNTSKQRYPALRYPIAGVVLQLLVMKDVLSSDPTRGIYDDNPFSWPKKKKV